MSALAGRATPRGTARYASRFREKLAREHFRRLPLGLVLSSIGLGSYLGEADSTTDDAYEATMGAAIRSGINVFDSAINYRHQRSERSFGRAIAEAVAAGKIARDEMVVATKGGFLAFDGDCPPDPQAWFTRTFVETGIVKPEDFVAQCHAMNPRYLQDQLTRSLGNLGLETVDIYYVHNPEIQLPMVGREEFSRRIRLAFEWAEGAVAAGKVGVYGLATWNGFRAPPDSAEFLSFEAILELAREVGGEDHHFRAAQLPLNLAMPEAHVFVNQQLSRSSMSFLEAAREAAFTVMASASILQGRMAGNLPPSIVRALPDFRTSAQRAIQFTRSTPGVATALVGMKSVEHLRENLEVARTPPLTQQRFVELFSEQLESGRVPEHS